MPQPSHSGSSQPCESGSRASADGLASEAAQGVVRSAPQGQRPEGHNATEAEARRRVAPPVTPLVLVALVLATYRLTVLVTSDTITTPLRRRWVQRFKVRDPRHPLAQLAVCGRCLSWWVAPLVCLAAHGLGLGPSWHWFPIAWPAVAGGAAVLVHSYE